MRIGFDAKRAYHNGTGLGHYSRTLIRSLASEFPEHEYLLFNPKSSNQFSIDAPNIKEVLPSGIVNRLFSSVWRSSWVAKDLKKMSVDLYHGLSHEIPFGIKKSNVKSVVTIHDLIPERHPEQYKPIDVKIYRKKFRFACANADAIIAISNQTRDDIVNYYGVSIDKITVCYQSCNPSFSNQVSDEYKQIIRAKYNLPNQFFLSVGSIIERKNLLNVCKAMAQLKDELSIPLVVIGNGGAYKQLVKEYIKEAGLENRIIFLSEQKAASFPGFKTAADFPAIYQMATALLYPSYFEGFGIPVLEGLWSQVPVITSNVSCLPEAGGKGAYYVNPSCADEIATAMRRIYNDAALVLNLKRLGLEHAQNFTPALCARRVMQVYQQIIK